MNREYHKRREKGKKKWGKRISNTPSTTLRINSEIMVGQAPTLPLQGITNIEVKGEGGRG